jgi:hypothetical protein
MGKKAKHCISPLVVIGVLCTLMGCLGEKASSSRKESTAGVVNSPSSVNAGFGRYMKDNPIVLSGDPTIDENFPLGRVLSQTPDFIVDSQFLIGSCRANASEGTTTIQDCFQVKQNETSSLLSSQSKKWAFDTSSQEFLQVQMFGNLRDVINDFHDRIVFGKQLQFATLHESAYPTTIFNSGDEAFWFGGPTLTGFSNCNFENNAFFTPADFTICLGRLNFVDNVFLSQDPHVTWHEMGHGFSHILLNARNKQSNQNFAVETNLGYLFYDEAGAIGEGLADFQSYIMNDRTLFSDWGLGRFLGAPRPMSERESIHISSLSTSESGRLAYPDFINYDPVSPTTPIEEVHVGGQIMSHFLVALTESLVSTCALSQQNAKNFVYNAVSETLLEMGDQSTVLSDFKQTNTNHVNLNPDHALDWIRIANPINYRRMTQLIGKYMISTVGNQALAACSGQGYPQDSFEKLADNYGLLLFKTYNEDGNNQLTGLSGSNTLVTPTNRFRSVLISKDLIGLDNRENKQDAFIVDDPQIIRSKIADFISSGQITEISDQIDSDFAHNNNNSQVSGGEVVAIAFNLLNSSNSIMGGVHVLANDWDHIKGNAPCNNLGDGFPLDTEGGVGTNDGDNINNAGDCLSITKSNGDDGDTVDPVCLVQVDQGGSTGFAQQDVLMRQNGLDSNSCLGGPNSTKDCFVRAIKGADHGYYSKINPQNTGAETFLDANNLPTFNVSNPIWFEVSGDTPPGTEFNCRLRVRFTNCEDCWHDPLSATGDDYRDFEYSGHRPFKIINFKFKVIN